MGIVDLTIQFPWIRLSDSSHGDLGDVQVNPGAIPRASCVGEALRRLEGHRVPGSGIARGTADLPAGGRRRIARTRAKEFLSRHGMRRSGKWHSRTRSWKLLRTPATPQGSPRWSLMSSWRPAPIATNSRPSAAGCPRVRSAPPWQDSRLGRRNHPRLK
jgi:hypothetical protein